MAFEQRAPENYVTCTEIHNDATLTFEKRRRVYSQFVNGKTLERPH